MKNIISIIDSGNTQSINIASTLGNLHKELLDYVKGIIHECIQFLVQSFKETLQFCDEWQEFQSVSELVSHSVNSGGWFKF